MMDRSMWDSAGDMQANAGDVAKEALFEEFFDVQEIQQMQDAFSRAMGVASTIVRPDGSAVIKGNGCCDLCRRFRETEIGEKACAGIHAYAGRRNDEGPTIVRCSISGLMIAGTSIVVDGQHVASWLVGQIADADMPAERLLCYADRCGIDRQDYAGLLRQVRRMSREQFEEVGRFMFLNARILSRYAAGRLAKLALRQSEERFRYIFEEAPMGIGVFDLITHKTLQVNEKYAEVVGRSREEMLTTDWADITHPQDLEKDDSDTQYLYNNPGRGIRRDKRYIRPDGATVWARLTVVGHREAEGDGCMEITMMEDITEQKEREERILYLNYHDTLTGLYNRAFIEEARCFIEEGGALPVSVIVGDINGLKLINDAFGHQAGDALLVEIAQVLLKCCSSDDIAARIGGDEFLILMPGKDQGSARHLCRRILAECARLSAEREKDLMISSIALGAATKTSGDTPLDKLIRDAEDEMYRRKLLDRKSMHSSLIATIKSTMFEKSHETEAHAERLVKLSRLVGIELGLSVNELNTLALLATLHDIGKISVDDRILKKPGRLTDEEWAEIKKHPEAGYRIALAAPELNEIAEYILCHHEHWNGGGYPQGLRGDEIPLLSRIIAVVDAFDAMTEDRSYRKALSVETAAAEIRRNAGVQFDPDVAAIFLEKILPQGEGAAGFPG